SPAEEEGLFNGSYSAIGQLTFLSDFFDAAITYVNAYDPDGDDFGIGGRPAVANTYGGQINFRLFDDVLELGGGIAYVDIESISALDDFEVWSYQGTLAINDLLGEGNQLGVVAGVAPYTADFVDNDTSFLAEVFYRYQLNDNISITPSVVYIDDPDFGGAGDFDDSIIGNIRTTFQF
ncbi:MAG: carbohydrate porin, partial [Elainellaceae cyanobacterium]